MTASIAMHAIVLLQAGTPAPVELDIGGQAQALRVSLSAPPVSASRRSEQAALETLVQRVDRQAPPVPPDQPPTPRAPATQPAHPVVLAQAPATRPAEAAESGPETADTAVPQAATVNVGQHISAALQNHLARRFEYPWLARKRGWQGEVTLSLKVAGDGHLTDWAIFKTSGYSVLDKSALKAARAIQHLPEARGLLNGRSLQLQIPVRYQLLGS